MVRWPEISARRALLLALAGFLALQIPAYAASGATLQGARGDAAPATVQLGADPGPFTRLAGNATQGHALFVDDGNCPSNVDVYSIGTTLRLLGAIPSTACNDGAYFGANSLAITAVPGTQRACLVQTDFSHSKLLSFAVDLAAHTVAAAGLVDAPVPTDVKILTGGTMAVVSELTNGIETYGLSTACDLTGPLGQAAIPRAGGTYISSAQIDGTHLAAPDSQNSIIDIYEVRSGGQLALQGSTPSAVPGPDSVVGTGGSPSALFTGSATRGASSVQGYRLIELSGALKPLAGSPVLDPSGLGGAAVWLDRGDYLVVQGEQYTGTLGVYAVVLGTGLTLLQHVPLAADTVEWPGLFQQLGSVLYVDGMVNGDIEACNLSPLGISACSTVAVLPSPSVSQGMVVL